MTDVKMPLPGMAAISLFLLGLAVYGVFQVLGDRPPSEAGKIGVLTLCTIFACAGLGLIRMRRWGWALALGAVFCSMCFWCYSLFRLHQPAGLFLSIINLVFFLYLVRPEVTSRLR